MIRECMQRNFLLFSDVFEVERLRSKTLLKSDKTSISSYRQAGWIGTGGVNRDTYHLVLAKAFILLYNILFFLENISCQVNDNI